MEDKKCALADRECIRQHTGRLFYSLMHWHDLDLFLRLSFALKVIELWFCETLQPLLS